VRLGIYPPSTATKHGLGRSRAPQVDGPPGIVSSFFESKPCSDDDHDWRQQHKGGSEQVKGGWLIRLDFDDFEAVSISEALGDERSVACRRRRLDT